MQSSLVLSKRTQEDRHENTQSHKLEVLQSYVQCAQSKRKHLQSSGKSLLKTEFVMCGL